ncbi:polysaccharide deacetylase family protein [Empedobacter falsenii]
MNILTFDIEEWFHCDFITKDQQWDKFEVRIHEGTDRILDSMQKYNKKGTFFILGWIAKEYPEVVRKIKEQGHEIGCHSMWHELVHRFNKEQFYDDTKEALDYIEQAIGEKVNLYRAPAFSITEQTPWAIETLIELGFEFDASIFPAVHDYGGFPNFGVPEPSILVCNGMRLKEFPMNIQKVMGKNVVFSGGGFFRLFPYTLIKHWTKKSDYVMTYFHPRDFDADQPVLEHLPWNRKFKSYVGLKTCHKKFENFLTDFDGMSIAEADKLIDWSKVNVIKIK